MAKKHKKRRKLSGTRRRRSFSGSIDTQNVLGVVGGAILAGYVNKLIPATVNDKIVSGGKVALGIALPMFIKSPKTKNLISGIGMGMVAVGSVDLLKSFGALSGDFDIPVINGDYLGADLDEMGEDIPVINGVDDDMSGFMNDED